MIDEKNNSKVVNPHDKVFREVYSNKENARSLLAEKLPDKVLKLVDLNTLEISKDSFIEKELADYYSDMLYRVNLTDGSQGFIYVLFEHKSYYDKFVHLQLLEYKLVIVAFMLEQHIDEPLAAVCQIHPVQHVGIIISQLFFNEAVLADLQGIQVYQFQHFVRQFLG